MRLRRPALDDVPGDDGRQQAGDVGEAVGERHQDAREPGRDVQVVHLEPGVDASVEPQAHGQHGHGGGGVAARVRRDAQTDRRAVLTDTVDDLAHLCVVEAAAGQHPVGHHRDEHGEEPHAQVGQRGYEAVILDGEVQNLPHEGGQLGHERLVAVVLPHVRQHDGPERHRLQDLRPRDRRRARPSGAPQRAQNILLLDLLDGLALFGVFSHEEQEGQRPDSSDQSEDVEDGGPAAREAVG